MASGKDLFTSRLRSDGTYQAAEHLAQMHVVLGTPDPELIRQRSQKRWKWSPALENEQGELCDNADSFYGRHFFDQDSGMLRMEDGLKRLS
jgi:hypothetical protein